MVCCKRFLNSGGNAPDFLDYEWLVREKACELIVSSDTPFE